MLCKRLVRYVLGLALCSLALPAVAQNLSFPTPFVGQDGSLQWTIVRNDLALTMDGTPVDSALIANGSITFKPLDGGRFFVVASVPLLESELQPLLDGLQIVTSIKVSAIVNHHTMENPKLIFLHFEGTDTGLNLQQAVAPFFQMLDPEDITSSFIPQQPLDPATVVSGDLLPIVRLGTLTRVSPAVYKLQYARPDEASYKISGVTATPALGIAETAYVQVVSPDLQIFDVELALNGDEINPSMKILKAAGWTVSAMHTHYLTDTGPSGAHIFFLHASKKGNATQLFREVLTSIPFGR